MAQALKFHTVVSGKTLTIGNLDAFEGKRVEVIVMEEDAQHAAVSASGATRRRPLGLYRGRFVVSDDFDAPLPEDVQRYFDGDG
jgi:hypothetical protein